MKRIWRLTLLTAVLVSAMGMTACEKEENNDNNGGGQQTPADNSPAYAFVYQGQVLAAGDTIYYYPTSEEASDTIDQAAVEFYLKNLTDANKETQMLFEMTEGSMAMANYLEVCFGDGCSGGRSPWTSSVFTLAPGLNENLPVKFDYAPSKVTETTVIRVKVGENSSLARSQVMYLNVAASPKE